MASPRVIIYLGAPSVDDVLKSWKNEDVTNTDTADLPEFEIDPTQKTTEIAWRHLPSISDDPVESLSQELADTLDSTREDLHLERSLEIFTNRYNEDHEEGEDDEMNLCYPSEWSEVSFLTPQLAGYDFDVNEITELEDIPEANAVLATLHKQYSIIVAIVEISPCQLVMTKFGKSINLVKLVVSDQTRPNFEIACWDRMASFAQTLRVDDIIQFRGIKCIYKELGSNEPNRHRIDRIQGDCFSRNSSQKPSRYSLSMSKTE